MIVVNLDALDRSNLKLSDVLVFDETTVTHRPQPGPAVTSDPERIVANLIARYAAVAKDLGYVR